MNSITRKIQKQLHTQVLVQINNKIIMESEKFIDNIVSTRIKNQITDQVYNMVVNEVVGQIQVNWKFKE